MDRQPGGSAAWTCTSDVDDTFADFSNFGNDVTALRNPGDANWTWPSQDGDGVQEPSIDVGGF